MSIQFVSTDEEIRLLEEQFSQLFNGLAIDELERRRAGILLVKSRFIFSLSSGAYQHLCMAIKHLEEMIIAQAIEGSSLSGPEVDLLEEQVRSDHEFEAQLAQQHLSGESLEFQNNMAKAYGYEPLATVAATD